MKRCAWWLTAAALALSVAAGGCAKKQVRQEGEAGQPGAAERQGAGTLSGGPREGGLGGGGSSLGGGSSSEPGGLGSTQGAGGSGGPGGLSAGPVEPPPERTGALASTAGEKPVAGGGLPGETSTGLGRIFFDFDQAVITPASKETLTKNAAYLRDNPGARIRIEGHCDERGTTEYNLGLGDKRAKASFQYLTDLGVDPNRMTVVSYGEEMPLDPGHNEAAWDKNRRAEFVEIR